MSAPVSPTVSAAYAHESDVISFVSTQFGITAVDVRSLGGELDTNTWIRAADGSEYVLKISHCAQTAEVIWQNNVLTHLKQSQNLVEVPAIIPSLSGDNFVINQGHSETTGVEVARLATWVPGTILAELPTVPADLLEDWGRVAATITTALEGCPTQGIPETHYWDMRSALSAVEESLPYVTDAEQRRAVESIMHSAGPCQQIIASRPTSLIHQDLNDFNLVAQRDPMGRYSITGVLDVGDTIVAPRVAEIIVGIAYGMLRQSDPVAAAAQMVRGYASIHPLEPEDLELLFPLAALRLCVNATTWTRRATDSNAEYGARRMGRTWPTVEKLSSIDFAYATNVLSQANAEAIAQHHKESHPDA